AARQQPGFASTPAIPFEHAIPLYAAVDFLLGLAFLQSSGGCIGSGEVPMHFRAGSFLERLVECVDRLRVTSGLLQHEAEARIVRRSVGPHRRGAIEQSGGAIEVSLVHPDLGRLSNQFWLPLLIGFGEPFRLETTKS